MEKFATLIERFAGYRVLVVGDMVADEYVVGRPWRVSREAPVLVLRHADSFVRPGGAANTAYNLSALGATVTPLGVIGDDPAGKALLGSIRDAGMTTSGLFVDSNRPTSTKTRIVGKGAQEVQQQVVRIDRIDDRPLDLDLTRRVIDMVEEQLREVDALLISDYENGVISQEIVEAALPAARALDRKIIVDSHGDLFRFRGITAATPNQPEAESSTRHMVGNSDDLDAVGAALLSGMQADAVLITRGSEGLVLYQHNALPYQLPVSVPGPPIDVSGAGDTVAAVFTLAIGCGASLHEAAFLSNVAGGLVVQKQGAATVAPSELLQGLVKTRLKPPD